MAEQVFGAFGDHLFAQGVGGKRPLPRANEYLLSLGCSDVRAGPGRRRKPTDEESKMKEKSGPRQRKPWAGKDID